MTGREERLGAGPGWRQALTMPLLGTLLAATLDALLGLAVLRHGLEGVPEHAVFLAHTLARATVLGLCLSGALLLVSGIGALLGRRVRVRPHPTVWLLAGLVTWWIAPLALGLTDGGKISNHPRIELIRKVLPVACALALLVGFAVLAVIHRRLERRGGGNAFRLLGGACLAGVVVLDWLNLTRFPGLYLEAHTILAGGCVILGTCAAALLLRGSPLDPARSRLVVLGVLVLAGALLGAGVWARRHSRFVGVQAAEARLAQVTAEARRLTSPVLERLAPLERLRGGQKIELARVDPAAIRSALDERLPGREDLNVLWIAIDTLRADHTGFTPLDPPGSPRRLYEKNDTTPRMNELARDGFVFRRAFAPYPTSNYSYSSLLTGLNPCATPMYATKFRKAWTFPDALHAPKILGDHGRFTLGVTGFNDRASKNPLYFGHMRTGFEVYDPVPAPAGRKDPEVTKVFLDALDAGARGRPWFGLVHYMGPHDPYPDPGNPFSFGDGPKDRYDADIRQSDQEVGRLVDALRERGMLDRTAIVILSDHGEAFGEHGPNFHNSSLYQTQIHVPLLVRIPGLEGRVVDQPASLVDILPTTLSLLGIEDTEVRHGQDLFPLMIGETEPERFAFAERYVFRTGEATLHTRAVVFGPHKLIEISSPTPVYELYDLFADPAERRNLFGRAEAAEAQTRMLSLLEQELPRFVEHHARLAGVAVVSPETRWRREHDAAMEQILGADEGRAARVLSQYTSKTLLNSFDELSSEARTFLGPDGLEAFREALVTRYRADVGSSLQAAILRTLGALRDPGLVPFFEGEVKNENLRLAYAAAQGLSQLGNDAGRKLLEVAAASPGEDPCEAAVALGLIGEPRVLPLLLAQLGFRQYPILVDTLRALRAIGAKHEIPGLLTRIVPRVLDGEWRAPRLKEEVMNLLSERLEDPRSQEILLEYARSQDPELRLRAEQLLGRVMDGATFERNLGAYDSFLAGWKQATRGNPETALPFLEDAASRTTLPFLGLRLVHGQVLRGADRPVEARKVFEHLERDAVEPADAALAQSLLRQLDEGAPVFPRPEDVRLLVRDVTILTERRAHRAILGLEVENAGEHTLTGAFIPWSVALDVWFVGPEGQALRDRRPHLGNLPVDGLAPGAKARILLPINMPREDWTELVIEALLPRWGHQDKLELHRQPRPE